MSKFQVFRECNQNKNIALDGRGKKRDHGGRLALQPIKNNIIKPTANTKAADSKVVLKEVVANVKCENKATVKVHNVEAKKLDKKIEVEIKPLEVKCSSNEKFDVGDEYEYLNEIHSNHMILERKMNTIKPNYMEKQPHLAFHMREILVDWLAAVAMEYSMNEQTLHLSVNYVDRFLSRMSVIKSKFQLLGATAMMIAGKVEEIYPPDTSEWSYLTDNTYSVKKIIRMEQLILKVLEFNLQPPTVLTFLQHLCSMHNLDSKTMHFAMYISELMLLEGNEYFKYLPSKLAAACVYLARLTLEKSQPWPKKLENSSGYTLKQLSPIVQKQNRTFIDSPTKPNQTIRNKYKDAKYNKVALLKPKVLNLEEGSDAE